MEKPIKAIAEVRVGYNFREKIINTENGNFRILQIRDIDKDGNISLSSISRVNIYNPIKEYIARKGDILLQNRGERTNAIVIEDEFNDLIVSSHFFIIRPKFNIKSEYLAWYINSKIGQRYIKSCRRGSYILSIPKDSLIEMPVIVPPLDIQEKIVKLDKLVRLNDKLSRELILKKNILAQGLSEKLLKSKYS